MVPRVSVVMPVYNAAAYLAESVGSVLAQTFAEFELIAIDDGSGDDSAEILLEFARRDARVIVLRQLNRGIVSALNAGLQVAQGEFVARMDADDVAHPQRFERQVAFLDAESRCVAVGSQALQIDREGAAIGPMRAPLTHEEIDRWNLARGGGGIPHPTAMIRRAAIEAGGRYREAYRWAEDGDLFLRLAEIGRLANLPDALLEYRLHVRSVTFTRRVEMASAARRAIADACRRREVADVSGDAVLGAESPLRRFDVERAWAWTAVEAGNRATARKYALRVFLRNFWFEGSWKLLEAAFFSGDPATQVDNEIRLHERVARRLVMAALRGGMGATRALRWLVKGRLEAT